MARTSRKHLPPSKRAARGREKQKASDESLRRVGKTHKQQRAAERTALRKEYR